MQIIYYVITRTSSRQLYSLIGRKNVFVGNIAYYTSIWKQNPWDPFLLVLLHSDWSCFNSQVSYTYRSQGITKIFLLLTSQLAIIDWSRIGRTHSCICYYFHPILCYFNFQASKTCHFQDITYLHKMILLLTSHFVTIWK